MNSFREKKINNKTYKTLNSMGYTSSEPDEYEQIFIDAAEHAKNPLLDIGACFGVSTIPALKNGAYVIANDIEIKHLEILRENALNCDLSKLTLCAGKIPGNIYFSPNSLSSVIAARSLHFLPAIDLDIAISQIHTWLEPGGNFIFVGTTPYLKPLNSFVDIFLERKSKGEKWPGEINILKSYFPNDLKNDVPNLINLMDLDILKNILENHGFIVEKISYFSPYEDLPDVCLDGRELVGAMAKKPKLI